MFQTTLPVVEIKINPVGWHEDVSHCLNRSQNRNQSYRLRGNKSINPTVYGPLQSVNVSVWMNSAEIWFYLHFPVVYMKNMCIIESLWHNFLHDMSNTGQRNTYKSAAAFTEPKPHNTYDFHLHRGKWWFQNLCTTSMWITALGRHF